MTEQMDLWNVQAEKPVREPLTMRKPLTEAEQMFEWAKEHGFPKLEFSLGRSWIGTVQTGETNWQGFCKNADPHAIRLALKQVQS